ncbi:Tropinesterase [Corynebacterium cystitidis DSM 20524]|uniref:Pimeloyl-ACP methyl ester carboxylesterase n=1 Tax=Corynebacterium cystitidis DSM 20524 TaxID=1121357 RepID=A0A1H9VNU8_9CORY|nr:Tropinesterase [Corynebacterium cystitidis DSM 20524]SES23302.1 Pimeloyl-ACP methyl ester carboxylesterase [Corynebacterium cystitidis DSM 20524]SNV69521.1 predicted hydrolase/acyltransferase [Corynebacterium cystitidis]
MLNDDVPVHWYEVGQPDAEITVVYIHGFTLAAEAFYQQVNALRGTGVRQVLMDLRGHGQTGAVPPEECSVDAAADDVWAVMREREVRGPVIVVGHSLGGLVALSLIRRYTHQCDVAGVVLINASVEALADQGIPQILATPVADAIYDAVEASPEEADKFRNEVTKIIAPGLAVTIFHRDTDDELIDFHAAMIHETPLETYVGFFDDLQVHEELQAGPALAGVPGYVLVGTQDDVTPLSQAERIQEIWPDSYLQVVPNAGHMLPLEAPESVTVALLRLIEKVS